MSLKSQYAEELAVLKQLYKPEEVEAEMARMDEVFTISENFWLDYLKKVPGQQVRYLMLSEAPPCTDDEEVQYIFNPAARPRTLITAIVKAFFDEPIYKEIGMAAALEKLAERGFLMIDSIPFAMPYSKASKRGKSGYASLIEVTARSYMLHKINQSGINWHPDVRIAFSLRKTAEILIDTFPDGVPFEGVGRNIPINENMIAINAANYPDAAKLKELYGLS